MIKWLIKKYLSGCMATWDLKSKSLEKRIRKATDEDREQELRIQYHHCIRNREVLNDIVNALI